MTKEELQTIGEIIDQKLDRQKAEIITETQRMMDSQRAEIITETQRMMDGQRAEIITETQRMMDVQRAEITHETRLMMENYFDPKFNLLAENQQIMMEKLKSLDDLEVLDTRVSALEAMVKKINRELKELKKAQ